MNLQQGIDCLYERIALRAKQEKENIQIGQHFEAVECRRQIQQLTMAIEVLKAVHYGTAVPSEQERLRFQPSALPGCPTNGRPENGDTSRRSGLRSFCNGVLRVCKGISGGMVQKPDFMGSESLEIPVLHPFALQEE